MEHGVQTKPYDSADYLDSEEAIVAYVKVAFEEGDADDIRTALNAVARARGMTGLFKESCVARQALYKALGKEGNPTLDTLLAVTRALGVKLTVAASVSDLLDAQFVQNKVDPIINCHLRNYDHLIIKFHKRLQ